MQRRSFVIAAAMVTGLVLGIIFGPTVRGTIASAQTQPPVTQPQSKFDSLRNVFLDKLAAALNIQRPALDSAITTAGNDTLDEAVQQGTLTQEQADAIKPRIQSGDVGPLFGGRGHGHGPGRSVRELFGVRQAMIDAAAKALGLTTDELRTQMRSGQTLAQLAQAHNTTEQAVKDVALVAAKAQLDLAVTTGTLTQEQADAIYARLQQEGLELGGHRGGWRGGREWPNAPKTPATPQAPSTAPGV
jgi:hypothetical protein